LGAWDAIRLVCVEHHVLLLLLYMIVQDDRELSALVGDKVSASGKRIKSSNSGSECKDIIAQATRSRVLTSKVRRLSMRRRRIKLRR